VSIPGAKPVGAEVAFDLSVVVPCYRDEENLPELFERVGAAIVASGRTAELVIVDDGSPDRTGLIAEQLARDFPHHVVVVRLLRNFGQHPAVYAGFAECRGQVVVTMDSDLQYPPEEIPRLLDALGPDVSVVSGYRANRRDPFVRRVITGAMGAWLRKRTGTELRDFGSMFRAYDRTTIELLLRFREQRRFIPALVAWLGVPVREIPVEHAPRGSSGSRYRLGHLIDMALDLVTGYSIFPLRIVLFLGFIGAGVGFSATLGFVVYRVAIGAGVARQVSAFALLFFLLGIQLLIAALLGEYVGRVYTEVRGRPYYLVREVVRHD
jgi:undecaprenyl-phosphate 4-deoxy-4-formamido-L-arabinose transferase